MSKTEDQNCRVSATQSGPKINPKTLHGNIISHTIIKEACGSNDTEMGDPVNQDQRVRARVGDRAIAITHSENVVQNVQLL